MRNRQEGFFGGDRSSSAVPKGTPSRAGVGAGLRGVVLATYVQLDGPEARAKSLVDSVVNIYCDVLVYSPMESLRGTVLRSVLFRASVGMHDGEIRPPRATTMDVSGRDLRTLTANPSNLDGDHVLVGFVEDDWGKPIITGLYPHPRAGEGEGVALDAGHRVKLKVADGRVLFSKRNGTYFGIDKDGNFVLDTTRAHSGNYAADGGEVPASDANHGNVTVNLGAANNLRVVVDGGAALEISGKDANALAVLGNGARAVAIAEELQAKYEELKAVLEAWGTTLTGHTHAFVGVPAGSPGVTVGPSPLAVPAWDPAINSTKLKVPG